MIKQGGKLYESNKLYLRKLSDANQEDNKNIITFAEIPDVKKLNEPQKVESNQPKIIIKNSKIWYLLPLFLGLLGGLVMYFTRHHPRYQEL